MYNNLKQKEFNDITVSEIMTHRTDMFAVDINMSPGELVEQIIKDVPTFINYYGNEDIKELFETLTPTISLSIISKSVLLSASVSMHTPQPHKAVHKVQSVSLHPAANPTI